MTTLLKRVELGRQEYATVQELRDLLLLEQNAIMNEQGIPLQEKNAITTEQNKSFHLVQVHLSYKATVVDRETATILHETDILGQEYDLLRQAYDILPHDQDVILLQQAAVLQKCDTIDQAINLLEAASEGMGNIVRKFHESMDKLKIDNVRR